ncbi:MAG TPA: hypothetical protein VN368_01395 [Candidatus Methylomirabilis sp.]|nr:hypothetical protein [Candidatus Methylomirabilis sp.]
MSGRNQNNECSVVPTPGKHPEEQILQIVKENKEIPLAMLPKHLRRTSLWTLELERQGLIKRVAFRVRGSSAILLVATENLFKREEC